MDFKKRPEEPLSQATARLTAGDPPPADAGLFGADPAASESHVIVIPVPWDHTASFGKGTARVVETLVKASHYLDFEDGVYDRPYQAGFRLDDLPPMAEDWAFLRQTPEAVNPASAELTAWLRNHSRTLLQQNKIPGVLGGEHSAPLGLMQAIGDHHGDFGILHIDAHLDLRRAYEGFEESHASIMYNAIQSVPQLKRLVQVGIRDFSREEVTFARQHQDRIKTYYDRALFQAKSSGIPWRELAANIVGNLPEKVYISFDIDGLDPALCPHTGTPVPGGLTYNEAVFLLDLIASHNRQIVGFDLCEVAPGNEDPADWDCNVGARILYRLCSVAAATNGLCERADKDSFCIEELRIK